MPRLLLTGLMFVGSSAMALLPLEESRDLLADIAAQTQPCALALYVGSEFKFESACSELLIHSNVRAQIYVEGKWYTVKISESTDTDGGDLDNMKVYDSSGHLVAQRLNVVAFDNVIIGMLGGNRNF